MSTLYKDLNIVGDLDNNITYYVEISQPKTKSEQIPQN